MKLRSAAPCHTVLRFTAVEEIEGACAPGGVLSRWGALLKADPTATFFQTEFWCLTWYRSYASAYDPLVLAVVDEDDLVGLATLACDRRTGRLVFAGDEMSDYRDFLAVAGRKEEAIASLIATILPMLKRGMFSIGPTQPDSATAHLVRALAARTRSFHVVAHAHPCWRLEPPKPEIAVEALRKKQSIRCHSNYYRHQGPLAYRRIRSQGDWDALKEVFFEQHSLRQLYSDRPVSFNEPNKRRFYGALLASGSPHIHFSVLQVADRPLAFHFGFLHDGTLYYGAPAFDIREQKHSPGHLLLVELLAAAFAEGCTEIDFTLGVEPFKSRFGNRCVQLPIVDLYASRLSFAKRCVRDRAIAVGKGIISEDGWTRVKAYLKRAQTKGPAGVLRSVLRRIRRIVYERNSTVAFRLTPNELRECRPRLSAGDVCAFRENDLGIFLSPDFMDSQSGHQFLRTLVAGLETGHTLHTVIINGRLAAWGLSRLADAVLHDPDTRTEFSVAPRTLSVSNFFTMPEMRGRHLYPALLTHILTKAFSSGAHAAFISCSADNRASRAGIRRVGFRLAAAHHYRRVLRWSRSWQEACGESDNNGDGRNFASVLRKGWHNRRWLPTSAWRLLASRPVSSVRPLHFIVAVADHFEPGIDLVDPWQYVDYAEQVRRVNVWCQEYPKAVGPWRDSDGQPFRHTYFYPAEQYDPALIDRLAEHCQEGWGEIEIHLHHGVKFPDSPANTRKTLLEFRDALAARGCLSRWEGVGQPRYAFVHGNWALANSAGGRFCGVDEEMQILAETGCYADMTLPSAPNLSQVAKINALYECSLPLDRRAPHRRGRDLRCGRPVQTFPLIVQGPLGVAFMRGRRSILPYIENGELTARLPPTMRRLRSWRRENITVEGRPEWVFVKLYCHGMDPRNEAAMYGEPLQQFLRELTEGARGNGEYQVHFVAAREMANIVLAACDGRQGNPGDYRDYRLKLNRAAVRNLGADRCVSHK